MLPRPAPRRPTSGSPRITGDALVTDLQSPPAARHQLAPNQIGLGGSVMLAISSTAPVFTIAATIGLMAAVVGVATPILLVLSVIPALLVALAYRALNEVSPDAGTTFTWGAMAIGPRTGWMGGWSIIISSIIFSANAAQVVAVYFWQLFGNDEPRRLAQMLVGAIFIVAMTALAYAGVKISARTQTVTVAVQLVLLLFLAGVAVFRIVNGEAMETADPVSLDWFNPWTLPDLSTFSEAVLLGVFVYWGWDSAMSVNEETREPGKTPGRSVLIATGLLVLTFVLVSAALQGFAGVAVLGDEASSEDVFAVVAEPLLGSAGTTLLIVIVLISTCSALATTILPSSRTMFVMAAADALPRPFARLNSAHNPSVATIAMGAAGLIFYLGISAVSTHILSDTILSVGLAIAAYYAITAFACVAWFVRRATSLREWILKVALPLLGALLMTWVFVRSAIDMADADYGDTSLGNVGGVFIIGAASITLGFVIMLACNATRPAFFRRRA